MLFGTWIRNARTRIGLKQCDMADALDVHWTTLSRWERGVADPRPQQLTDVARLYIRTIMAQGLWARGDPVPDVRVPRAAAFCKGGTETGAQWFMLDALSRGERVNVLSSGQADCTHGLSALLAEENLPPKSVRDGQVQMLPLQSVFAFGATGLDVRKAVSAITREEFAAAEQGFSAVAWVGDFRAIYLEDAAVQADILTLERLTEYLARSGSSASRGLIMYPVAQVGQSLMACLLCTHSLIVTPKGPVRNPFYNDRTLCIAKIIGESAQPLVDSPQVPAPCSQVGATQQSPLDK